MMNQIVKSAILEWARGERATSYLARGKKVSLAAVAFHCTARGGDFNAGFHNLSRVRRFSPGFFLRAVGQ